MPVCPLVQPWQVPVHALLQQKPSAQKPVVHSSAAVQEPPWALLATQAPAEQYVPDSVQSPSKPHMVSHALPPLAQTRPLGQGWGVPAVHVPVPLQRPVGVQMSPEQVCVPHSKPVGISAHVPPAAQAP